MAGTVTVARNLCPNPAFANDATGWSSSSGSYARSTSVAAGMPRTTGFEATATGTIDSARALVTAGFSYVLSIWVNALAAQNLDIYWKFYNGTTGGTFISQTATQSYTLAAGVPTQLVIGPVAAPAGALSAQLKIAGIDAGGIEITGCRVAPYSGDVAADTVYFDGATAGATWDGTAGNSTSTKRSFADTILFQETFSKTVTADPNSKVHIDSATLSSTWNIAASGTVNDSFHVVDGFLVASLSFDPARGRVRLDAYTFAPGVTHANVYRRKIGGRYELIRGGNVPITNGRFSRIVDDFEYPAGEDSEYLIEGLTDTEVVVQRALVKRSGVGDKAWIKIVANPRFNQRVRIVKWGDISRRSRNGRFDVIGRPEPVITADYFSSREVTVEFMTRTRAETAALDFALSLGIPVFLQVPAGHDLPSLYASLGDYKMSPANRLDQGHIIFTIPFIEVLPPPPSVMSRVSAYQFVYDDYATYNDVLAENETYERLAS